MIQNFKKEKENNGLLIFEAYYGEKSDLLKIKNEKNKIKFIVNNPNLKIIDVTNPLRFQVNNSQLKLLPISKNYLIGFKKFDDESLNIVLYISYLYRGIPSEIIIDNKESLNIP